jgi:excisionase family DNA binding protein
MVFETNLTKLWVWFIIVRSKLWRMPLSKDWLTADEVAEDLRVHVSTIREWIRQKKLKAAKFGRDYRIKRKDYEEFVEKHYNVDDDEQKQ